MNDWTAEQLEDLYRYGLCPHCGWPRRAIATEDGEGNVIAYDLGCWNENCDPRLVYLGRV